MLKETSIALWLINSDISNPSLEDILLFSKNDSFIKAYGYIFQKIWNGVKNVVHIYYNYCNVYILFTYILDK